MTDPSPVRILLADRDYRNFFLAQILLLPIGAVVSSVLAPRLGPVVTMRAVGLFTMAVTIPLTFRRSIIDLR